MKGVLHEVLCNGCSDIGCRATLGQLDLTGSAKTPPEEPSRPQFACGEVGAIATLFSTICGGDRPLLKLSLWTVTASFTVDIVTVCPMWQFIRCCQRLWVGRNETPFEKWRESGYEIPAAVRTCSF